ncbi:uncharacterized protein LOC115448871 [Manduca sexta]|uniref:uncharacterized protein LOC115448871 n=1 Tax=Manduca sexta TaxID=7130 RepID=UPI0011832DFF|nr:uncharacterized protein LOC115448871 [Manduca sexta]
MKFFVALTLIVAVASARFLKPTPVSSEIQEIIAAIQSPSTNPATAAALEQMLQDYLGVGPSPISVGPAIIDHHPISVGPAIVDAGDIAVGPAIIDFPLPDGGAVSAPVEDSPVMPGPAAAPAAVPASSPLVQIVVNVNAPAGAGPVVDAVADKPVDIIDVMPVVDPAQVVDPVQVVDTPIVVDPVQVVDTPIVVDPVQVVEVAPVAIGTPVFPSPAINLPEELN